MPKLIIYMHGSKRVGKTIGSEELVRLATEAGYTAEMESIVGIMRGYLKDVFELTDAHIHGDLKEVPLEQYNGNSTRNLMDDFVTWHFTRDPSRLCFLRGCMARASRSKSDLVCIQDVIHTHEPSYIQQQAERMGAVAIGVHVSRPGFTETYGTNMPFEEFDYRLVNSGTRDEYMSTVQVMFYDVVMQYLRNGK